MSARRRFVPSDPLTRRMALGTLVSTFGNGLFFTISALYFTRIVGLSVTQVGFGLTLAGGFGVAAGVPAGRAADRFGARGLLVVLLLIEGAGMLSYPLITSMWTFLPIVCLVEFVDRAGGTVRSTLVAVAVPPDERAATRAYLRAVTNIGMGAGSAVAALALQADTRAAYVSVIVVNALTFAVSAAVLARLPIDHLPARSAVREDQPRMRAHTDRPYLAVTALNSVLVLQFGMLEVGIPLWIVGHTAAPRVLVSVLLIANTAIVVLLQVRASRGITSLASAARAARWSGLLLAGACLLYAAAGHGRALPAAIALLVGGVVQTLGEVISSAAGWTLSYDLADPRAPGAYQGVFGTGTAAAMMLAPVIVTVTALHLGFAGWLILAAAFAGAGAALVPVTRWAARTRADTATAGIG